MQLFSWFFPGKNFFRKQWLSQNALSLMLWEYMPCHVTINFPYSACLVLQGLVRHPSRSGHLAPPVPSSGGWPSMQRHGSSGQFLTDGAQDFHGSWRHNSAAQRQSSAGFAYGMTRQESPINSPPLPYDDMGFAPPPLPQVFFSESWVKSLEEPNSSSWLISQTPAFFLSMERNKWREYTLIQTMPFISGCKAPKPLT